VKLKDPDKIHLIYDATLKLVKENGLAGLNMAAIGKEAKLGMGTMYVYFKSKEELINSLFKRLKGVNTNRIYSVLKPKVPFKVSMKDLFDNYIKNRVEYFEEHFFVEQCSNSHYLDAESKKLDEAAFIGVFELLNKGKKELLIKDLDNTIIAAHMMGSANELVSLCMKNNQRINKRFLDNAFSLCWDGIKR
jgi:TetR/AcrR family transcriptional regulator, repressor of fatR-cypB operon